MPPLVDDEPPENIVSISGSLAGSRERWVEMPMRREGTSAWCYSDQRSYCAGDCVQLYISSTEPELAIRILRDHAKSEIVYERSIDGILFQATAENAYREGCAWTPTIEWHTPEDLRSGVYLIELRTAAGSEPPLGHHLVVIRPARAHPETIAFVLSTATWAAYNDWGGASHYYGNDDASEGGRSPILSSQRPWARGQVWLPAGAPRFSMARPRKPQLARYETIEWARLHGFSKYYAAAGWATYERHFVHWVESNGYSVDVFTQDDLHYRPETLAKYRCIAFVGHDEYWTWEMRDAIDAHVASGGRILRLAGNFMWQVRLERDGERQIAYKYDARRCDPILSEGDRSRMTGSWVDPWIGRPGASTFGVDALHGLYAGIGAAAPRASRGFTVFRPEHWAFSGTGLGYADVVGDEARVFGYEVDGLEYTFCDGLPFPSDPERVPAGLEIVAMGWATLAEHGLPEHRYEFMLGVSDAQYKASLFSANTDAAKGQVNDRYTRGSGMIVSFRLGDGEVFTVGSCEWIQGLIERDFYVERITHNVLQRFISAS